MSEDMELEARFAEFDLDTIEGEVFGDMASPFGCPECGGTLSELSDEKLLRFRCRVGHAYAGETLLASQGSVVERALWNALRALEERASLARRMADRLERGTAPRRAFRHRGDAEEAERDAAVLRTMLMSSGDGND